MLRTCHMKVSQRAVLFFNSLHDEIPHKGTPPHLRRPPPPPRESVDERPPPGPSHPARPLRAEAVAVHGGAEEAPVGLLAAGDGAGGRRGRVRAEGGRAEVVRLIVVGQGKDLNWRITFSSCYNRLMIHCIRWPALDGFFSGRRGKYRRCHGCVVVAFWTSPLKLMCFVCKFGKLNHVRFSSTIFILPPP